MFARRYLFNLLLKCKEYPTNWKETRICPIFEGSDKCKITNYRSIALICNLSKAFETVFYSSIYPIRKIGFCYTSIGLLIKDQQQAIYSSLLNIYLRYFKTDQVDVIYNNIGTPSIVWTMVFFSVNLIHIIT